jgi:photosystem II stability/assembly factor-like uncharacterized protein
VAWGIVSTTALGYEPFVETSFVGTANLRAISVHEDNSWWVVGDAGTAAFSEDHGETWIPVALPSTADLYAIDGHEFRSGGLVVAVGAGGTVLVRKSGAWERARNNEHVDLLGYVSPYALGANGELFEVHSDGTLSRVGKKMRGTQAVALGWGVVAVGNGGAAFRMEQEICIVCSAN